MNKLLVFPLSFMYLVSIFIFLLTTVEPTGTSEDFTESDQITINGTDSSTGYVEIPTAGKKTFNLWEVGGILYMLLTAISLGVIVSISVLGSGVGSLGQSLIFNSILFLGIWVCLTVVSADFMFSNIMMSIIYMVITMMYVTGFGIHVTSGDDE